jgi:hypothetical protein
MEEHLSHEIRVDVKIAVGGLDVLVPHHLFDLINGPAHAKEILGIGVPEPVGR